MYNRLALLVLALLLLPADRGLAEPITTIADILALSPEQAAERPRFDIEATVYGHCANFYFVFLEQDGHFFSCGIDSDELAEGSVIRASGRVTPGLVIHAGDIESFNVAGTKELAEPVSIRLEEESLRDHDCAWVTVKAQVEAIRIGYEQTIIHCRQGASSFKALVARVISAEEAATLIDATVTVTGNVTCETDDRGEVSGFAVSCGFDRIRIIEPAKKKLSIASEQTVKELWNGTSEEFYLNGQVVWEHEPRGFVVQTTASGSWINNPRSLRSILGSKVEVWGRRNPQTRLLEACILAEHGIYPLSQPEETPVPEILSSAVQSTRVRVRGKILASTWEAPERFVFKLGHSKTKFDVTVKATKEQIFSLDLRTAKEISVAGAVTFNPEKADATTAFRILASSVEDITVVERRAIWTSRTVGIISLVSASLLGILLIWGSRLRSKVSEGEKNIQNITAELQHAFNSVREGMVVLGQDRLVAFANQQASKALGIKLDVGMTSDELLQQLGFDSYANDNYFSSQWTKLNESETETKELRLQVADDSGERRQLEIFTSPVMNQDGEYINRLWTFHDITEREQLQTSLAHMQKQEAVGRLASGFAHDFNNLLQAILGNLTVATLDPDVPVRDAQEPIQAAMGASKRAASLVRQILSFSRQLKLERQNCDINEILRQMDNLLQPSFDSTIKIEYDLAEHLPPVFGDATRLEQVFINVCLNARDAVEDGKEGQISVRTYTEEDQCVISIRDNGVGITPETQPHVFEPFFTTKQGLGTGLGLSMCEGIIHRHGGHIEFESKPTVGTEFRIYLPIPKESFERSNPPEYAGQLGGKCGLVVDDQAIVRNSLAKMLESQGIHVTTASDGIQALAILSEEQQHSSYRFDFVILDWLMPIMGGQETLKEIKSNYPDLPTIICSGHVQDCEEVLNRIGIRPDAVLQKPFRPEQISRLITNVLVQRNGTETL